jgi:hypothetical protein
MPMCSASRMVTVTSASKRPLRRRYRAGERTCHALAEHPPLPIVCLPDTRDSVTVAPRNVNMVPEWRSRSQ